MVESTAQAVAEAFRTLRKSSATIRFGTPRARAEVVDLAGNLAKYVRRIERQHRVAPFLGLASVEEPEFAGHRIQYSSTLRMGPGGNIMMDVTYGEKPYRVVILREVINDTDGSSTGKSRRSCARG